MKKVFFAISMLVFLTAGTFAQTLTVATVNAPTGTIATVPVTYTGPDQLVTALQINIGYNPNLVSFLKTANINSDLSSNGTVTLSNLNNGTVVVLWEATDFSAPLTFTNNMPLYEMSFIANEGGVASLNIVFNEILDDNFDAIAFTLNHGSITYPAATATTTWNGTGNWYEEFANWSNGFPGGSTDAIIASGVVTINDLEAITKNITINAGAGATLNASKKLSVNGDFTLASANNALPTGTFLNNNSGTTGLSITGAKIAQRWFSGGTSHMVSIPVQAATIQDFYNAGNTGYFYGYNEVTASWENPWDLSYPLDQAEGYLVDYQNNQLVSVSSPFNNDGTYQPIVTFTNNNGWYLTGNPYPTALNWDEASGWTKTKVDNAIYVWNGNQYASYVGGNGANGGTKYLAPFQGFFIHANASAPTFAIKKAARLHHTTNYMKSGETRTLRIMLNKDNLMDESVVVLSDNATTGFDTEMDAYKLMSLRSDVPTLFTRNEGVEYSINRLPSNQNNQMNLVTNAPVAGDYTFSFNGTETFESDYSFLLKDKLTGEVYDLRANNVITLSLSGNSDDRFELNILKSGLGIGNTTLANANVYANGQTLYFENCANSIAKVYSVSGNLVMSQKIGSEKSAKAQVSVASGAYMVQITSNDGVATFKVFIQ